MRLKRKLSFAGSPQEPGAMQIVRRIREDGHEAWLVGGCVRNALLGMAAHDLDIATSAQPERIAQLLPRVEAVGAHFGVLVAPSAGGPIEIATFRAEGAYVDRRRPSSVRFGSFDEDWPRRDFTVNALYYDPVDECIADPSGGLSDLEARVLRAVGDPEARFCEDALRLMRGVRFAARYGFTLEPVTESAMRSQAGGLAEISVERIAGELVRILTGPNPGRAVLTMRELDFWRYIIPEIDAMAGCEQPPEFHPEGDVLAHTALVLDAAVRNWPGGEPPAPLALAALLHDVGKPPTEAPGGRPRFPGHQSVGAEMTVKIGNRLKMPRRVVETARGLVANHMKFMNVGQMRQSTLRRFLAMPDFDLHLALHRADCEGCHGKLDNYEFCREQLRRLGEERASAAVLPDPLLNGRDLLALGVKPGPPIGQMLEAVRDEQLEGRLDGREAALEWVKRKANLESRFTI